MNSISIATNVTSKDTSRILNVLPNWLKVFGNNIEEINIVYDKKPTEGRINDLHKTSNKFKSIELYFNEIISLDDRIKIIDLDYNNSSKILDKWFRGNEKPIRCQAGTPIYAFIYAIDKAKSNLVLKVDCDMVFFDNGFVAKTINEELANEYDLIEISKTGSIIDKAPDFSTRAFFVNKRALYRKLPITAHKLNLLRQVHRKILKRSSYLAFEQMIQKEIENNILQRMVLSQELGYCMHICTEEEMHLAEIKFIIEMFGKGLIPEKQKMNSDNFKLKYWIS